MPASFNIELSPRPNREGIFTLYLRVTVNRQHKRIKTTILIDRKYYNPDAEYGRWIRKTHPRSKSINDALIGIVEEARKQYEALGPASSKEVIVEKILNPNGVRLEDYFQTCLKEMSAVRTYNHITHITSILTRFVDFLPKGILLSDVTTFHINQYKAKLQEVNKPNTVREYLKKIRQQFTKAVDNELIVKNPFDKVTIPAPETTNRKKLNDNEIEALNTAELSKFPFYAFKEELAIDLYYFSYLHGGIRIADLLQLRVKDFEDGRLTYEMDKTGIFKSVRLRPEGIEIYEKYCLPEAKPTDYLFPFLDNSAPYAKYISRDDRKKMPVNDKRLHYNDLKSSATIINRALRRIANKADIDGYLTFHTARHSFADKARRMMKEKKNITIDGIRLMLGHSKLDTTQRYLNNFDIEGQDDAHDAIFGD